MLNLGGSAISDDGAAKLASLKKLTKLDLSKTSEPGLTSAGIESVSKIPSLTSLNLWTTGTGDDAIEHLLKLKKPYVAEPRQHFGYRQGHRAA